MRSAKSWLPALAGAVALSLACWTAVDVPAVGASGKPLTAQQSVSSTHASRTVNAAGTYEWFINGNDDGHLTLNANGTWSSAMLSCDFGTWLVTGKTIGMADMLCDNTNGTGPIPNGQIWMGTVGKHGISSVKKPGNTISPDTGFSATWYAVKL